MSQQFSRRALYELVWSEPRTRLAKRLRISDVGLAKACAKAGIPMPPRGYWARLASSKRVVKTSLPPRALGQSDSVQIGSPNYRPLTGEEALTLPPEPVFDEPVEAVRIRAEVLLAHHKVPKRLYNPHRLIKALLDEDEARQRALETDRFALRKPQFDSPSALRRIRIVNALFLAMEHAGSTSSVSSADLHNVMFQVGDTCIKVEIQSSRRTARAKIGSAPPRDERMTLKATGWPHITGVPCEWADSETQSLETRIVEIARDLLVMGELTYRTAVHEQHEWRIKRKHELEAEIREAHSRIEQEENERRLRQEQKQQEWLLAQATNRRQADEIRALIHALDTKHRGSPEVLCDEAFRNWRAWALTQAESLDPCLLPLAALITPPKDDAAT
ncbi:hypothetical protein [Massilia sp. AB1]|uniref:hypothetical protein n=1 Tax=Massilia sp. AB1 TaxID=2823371 RepID=UPI001B81C7FC|nr:hypothetical protein [Massilia sp. AB1]MBQ5942680.1 hypothetical protein [Massilia sp. AB1]